MKLINGISLLAAIIFTGIFGDIYSSPCNITLSNGIVNCCTHFFFNGVICTECPAGFFGKNCSSLCSYPNYGILCKEECGCSNSSCHHAYGCKTTTVSSTAMRAKKEETVKKKNYLKIIIVVIGISLSAILLLLIAREIYQLPRIHEICGNSQLPSGSPNEDNVYNEIALTSQDTSWT
ncbi:uncharacterized protein LOC144618057 [Crassostrea virginica]